MFNNPGTKIKKMAKVLFWIIVISSAIAILGVGADELFESVEGILIAVVALAGAALTAYVSCLFLYAQGELVETNTKLLEETRKKNQDPSVEYTKL